MTNSADITKAVYDRINNGEPFQAKHLSEIGEKLADSKYVFEDGAYRPISRLVDKILQFERKRGHIKFSKGWWRLYNP